LDAYCLVEIYEILSANIKRSGVDEMEIWETVSQISRKAEESEPGEC
jgi:hypothetical protein